MILTLFKLSLKALTSNKMRTLLTTLGIIVGISTVIIVLSVGAGLKTLILQQLSSVNPNTLFVEVQVPLKNAKPGQSAQALATGVQITTLKIRDVEDALKLPNIAVGTGMIMGQGKATYKNKEKKMMYYAVQASYPEVNSVQVDTGRFFTEEEDKGLSRVIVLGHDLATILFGTEDPLGKNVKMGQLNFKVVGVMKKLGMQMFMNMDEMAYVPLRTAQKMLLGIDHILYMSLKMKDKNQLHSTRYQLERLLRKNHNIKDPTKDDFAIRTMDEAMGIIDTVTGGISLLLLAIAAISLLVGGVGIMNVMYVTVTERTREIGLKKSIGAPEHIILAEFMIEAVMITLLGGFLGIGGGIFVSWLVSVVAGLFSFQWPFIIALNGVLLALAVSGGIGLIFGYAPARKAARLNPIEALRYE